MEVIFKIIFCYMSFVRYYLSVLWGEKMCEPQLFLKVYPSSSHKEQYKNNIIEVIFNTRSFFLYRNFLFVFWGQNSSPFSPTVSILNGMWMLIVHTLECKQRCAPSNWESTEWLLFHVISPTGQRCHLSAMPLVLLTAELQTIKFRDLTLPYNILGIFFFLTPICYQRRTVALNC